MMDKRTCKHFNGSFHNERCAAGVCYADVTPDWEHQTGRALRLPCHLDPWPNASPSQLEHYARRGSCDKFIAPTDEEIAEHEVMVKAAVKRHCETLPLIIRVKREHKGEDWNGAEECPVCGGKLHLSHAKFNGHVWGQCETKGCLSWME